MEVSTHLPFNDESNVSDIGGLKDEEECGSSDDNIVRGRGGKQRRRKVTETDSDVENAVPFSTKSSPVTNNNVRKSRIKKICDSDSDSQSPTQESSAAISRVSRVENKRINLHDKFKKLVTAQAKTSIVDSNVENLSQVSENESSDKSDGGISCLEIKKKIMKKKSTLSSACDADTSDDDVDSKVNIKPQRKVKSKPLKSTIEIQPRMSVKQAMENMQKIKSESNRMLREKDVSLPYHKPRALSLQDIINRRKPSLTSDGKAMPIKMNSEQLAQYVKFLEERQKEMIELCKSDSEDEAVPETISDQCNTNVEPENDFKEINNEDNQNIDKSSDNHFDEVIQGLNLERNKECNISVESGIIDEAQDDSNHKIEKSSINSEATCQNSANLDSQAITLKFNSEITANVEENYTDKDKDENYSIENVAVDAIEIKSNAISGQKEVCNDFSDGESDFNLEDIDNIIENAEIIKDISNMDNSTTHTVSITAQSAIKPKLTGTPGMFIDLETGDQMPKLLTGVDLLKERYTYFSKLKSSDDLEKNRIKKHKPGTQHFKLKYELEEQIADQRSLEWEKRLEGERQTKSEMNIESYDDIENLEAKLDDDKVKESSSSEDDDLVEDDVDMNDNPRKSNPMVDDEAEESNEEENKIEEGIEELEDSAGNDDSDNSSSDDSSSESEDEKSKPKKGRILKAFEDSDDETNAEKQDKQGIPAVTTECPESMDIMKDMNDMQDEEIQLAQFNRSVSEDIFATQGSHDVNPSSTTDEYVNTDDIPCTADLGSQTFSILDSAAALNNRGNKLNSNDKLSTTQSIDESRFDSFNKTYSGSLSQTLLMSQPLGSQSQEIGDDIAALCTGKFYDNPFVTQMQDNQVNSQAPVLNTSKEQEETLDSEKENNEICQELSNDIMQKEDTELAEEEPNSKQKTQQEKVKPIEDGNILKSILDELNEPEIETTNRFFVVKQDSQIKKRYVIDSDEENDEGIGKEKKKILKKRKPENRALQISDDEEEEEILEEEESEIEEETDEMVEYDSEENEIEVKARPIKKKRMGEFFENEAELTSEDEWVGSGDEDEAGLDRMEREEGDSEVYHQGRLQRELGQIHMREVLDQDKREVRLLQELLFEDGDLGDGHRQRKFRWKTDADGDDDSGTGPVNLADTQEEEFESEEIWRKQRHERELFLRSMQENEDEKVGNTTINRTAMIKANLNASNVSNQTDTKCMTETEPQTHVEAKPTKDIPSPKKPFLILQQTYHGSLLSRGRGALARLAALATPLVADADAPRPKPAASSAPGNFVFATLSQPDPEPKVVKRKAETNAGTPKLLKKMKTEETQKYLKNSLFDHFKT